ncbi:MAG: DNA mismatch repair protein MutS, partial [Clostridiaceae bacterium]|nr:DNA mismatch repair protein MutS [Clostridiaceae bacterium]
MSTLRFENIDKELLTPLMRQYVAEKESRPDCLIFMRLGDFYEVFFDDALLVARELELKLTGRDCGLDERAPMCGVPHHAVDKYLNRLLERGYKIAICEQVEDPAEAQGLVAREVVRVLTPGTQLDPDSLDASKYSIICAVLEEDGAYGIAACDLSSGHFETSDLLGLQAESHLFDELERFAPVEFVVNEKFVQNLKFRDYCTRKQITVTTLPDSSFSSKRASEFGIKYNEKDLLWHRSSAGLIYYLQDTQGMVPTHFGEIKPYRFRDYMILDRSARMNLELTETLRDRKRRGSLLWAVDHCKTAMGSRNLRQWLEQPLLNIAQIERRQDAVA